MPELPEVETIRRSLSQHILNQCITKVEIRWPGAVEDYEENPFAETVKGLRIQSIERRGKYLLFTLNEGWSFIAHMRMTGRLIYHTQNHEPEKHTHVVLKLDQGEVHFTDTRKFGRLQLVRTEERLNWPSLARLGPEPLENGFTPDELGKGIASRKLAIKAALLDQALVAGIGNIYADEALFRAGIAPERCANTLTAEEVVGLHGAIREVLQEGIVAKGTSFRDYQDANGEKGAFQKELKVYGRGGEACRCCGQPLEKIRLGGRSTVFCSSCQK
ncbi:bifunctional DNA-formamidopyrimidine glycosylase/DNA-(apurinic or apyrimidinic site) lyase [Desulfitobacterium sp. THU1]|uniref:bifunctional DNA-formamidopyrimidine glycosylase/DNA-(apurinic or apyrimidinic site) lyase n=1 Tax=Desulfitobacterium sp. THU1 TaxID=3138072 RepID=UPI00311EDE3B